MAQVFLRQFRVRIKDFTPKANVCQMGKTSVAHRFRDRYVVRDRTHGMNVCWLDLPLPPDAKLEREALLWDLAGQEDYRLIHSLFLQETALALLLLNPQAANPFRETGDWLRMLKSATEQEHKRDASRLLILSQSMWVG